MQENEIMACAQQQAYRLSCNSAAAAVVAGSKAVAPAAYVRMKTKVNPMGPGQGLAVDSWRGLELLVIVLNTCKNSTAICRVWQFAWSCCWSHVTHVKVLFYMLDVCLETPCPSVAQRVA